MIPEAVPKAVQEAVQRWGKPQYTPVDGSEEDRSDEKASYASSRASRSITICWSTCAFIGGLVVAGTLALALLSPGASIALSSRCKNPAVRREWRALNTSERAEYVHAVKCLGTVPSKLGGNGSLYDDFAALHAGIGSWCHRSSSFLPWHRYALVLWEDAMRGHCGFNGQIPYWDWSVDWMDLASSSIWDSSLGFGGDGNANGTETVGGGRCVTNGPFTKLRPILYNHTYIPHCISRGFHDGKRRGHISGTRFSPESIGRILREQTYQRFVHNVESQLHNTLHNSVAGDFLVMTASNDPVFVLHHAQLDRMWWRWQQENPGTRLDEYHGKHMYNSTGEASLNDLLMMGGFAEDMAVSQVMHTEGGFLCYRY